MRFVVSSLIALSLCGFAHAETREEFEVEIKFDTTQLETETGAQKVLAQIERQARKSCRVENLVSRAKIDTACKEDVVAKAVSKIDAPLLTLAYRGNTAPFAVFAER